MRTTRLLGTRIATGIGAIGAALLMAATPAGAAETWISTSQVAQASGSYTAAARETPAGIVQVRAGYYNGSLYGWGRAIGGPNEWLQFEVDTDGDRIPEEFRFFPIGDSHVVWTTGRLTSPSPNVAFRACILSGNDYSCDDVPAYRTAWW